MKRGHLIRNFPEIKALVSTGLKKPYHDQGRDVITSTLKDFRRLFCLIFLSSDPLRKIVQLWILCE